MKTILKNVRKMTHLSAIAFVCMVISFTSCRKDSSSVQSPSSTDQLTEAQVKSDAQNYLNDAPQDAQKQSAEINTQLQQLGVNTAEKNSHFTILNIAAHIRLFSSLAAAVQVTGLADALNDPNARLTVFAPTDLAFSKLPAPFNNAANISKISDAAQIAALKNILLYHVLGAEVTAQDIADGRSSAVTLKPQGSSNDNTLYLSKVYGLVGINGNNLVILPNVFASNGVIHIISAVLSFPSVNIAETAIGTPDLSTLVAALVKTNLAGVFAGEGNFTVFAPTNSAFAKLPAPFNNADNINAISDAAQISALANILKYHVLAERYFGFDLGFFYHPTTLADAPNNKLTTVIGYPAGYVKGNNNWGFSYINPGNILCTNGVVHVIPNVLQP